MRTLWWTLAIAGMSLISIVLSENRTFDPLQNLSLTVAAPIESGIRALADPASGFFQGVFDRGDIVRENERLRRELERLQTEVGAGEDARRGGGGLGGGARLQGQPPRRPAHRRRRHRP